MAWPVAVVAALLVHVPAPASLCAWTSCCFNITFALIGAAHRHVHHEAFGFQHIPHGAFDSPPVQAVLNVASTRLILLHGDEGTEAAGEVIRAFGQFVVGGNYLVGLVIFLILVLINFIVITKGSPSVSPRWRPASPWTPCPASRWQSTPT
jgi:flagellar biosynthesis protein FlhA